MTNKWKLVWISALLLIATIPSASGLQLPVSQVVAAAAAPSVEVDKSSARRGQSIAVSGTYTPNSWITLRAIDSEGKLVVFDGTKTAADGAYSFEIVVPTQTAAGSLAIYTGAGEEIAQAAVRITTSGTGGGSTGGSGGGAPSASPAGPESAGSGKLAYQATVTARADGRTEGAVVVEASSLQQALEGNPNKITITVEGDADGYDVRIASEALRLLLDAGRPVTVEVVTQWGTYVLPVALVDREALAAVLRVPEEAIGLRFAIGRAADAQASTVEAAAGELNADLLAAIVDFHVAAVTEDGQTAELTFGNTYIARTLPLSGQADASRTTGVRYDERSGKLVFVPSVFHSQDGAWQAELKRNGHSVYTVIAYSKSFDDIPPSHWGKEEVELLASKLIVSGLTEDTFGPAATVTRAEFAALIVRALGLEEQGASAFADVPSTAWFAGAVGAAYEAGLVSGYEDGSFRPNQPITRQELAMLMDNALRFTGQPASGNGQLNQFADREAIAAWAQGAVGRVAQAGITQGRGDNRFEPTAISNRAEAAAMIKRLLQHVNFID
ncbi:S-layer homology domain-containing protein [Xylanibacillus composti]|uniref:SLH domain-containing protein n=1 Tax=Xylanibacillus composti TaxID=1572762 RepID=A0A8J4M3R7_9BACL|nr:S-layer homology domain-containing protein [Xylanibacillus composti]GIQ71104.1 hypothetical protein XYCOK13_39280 [Xylanibacillus composti]